MNCNMSNFFQARGFLTKPCSLSWYQNSKNEKTAVGKFTLAIKDNYGNEKDDVTFIQFTIFGKQAETLSQYTVKGSQLLVNATVRNSSYTKKSGKEKNEDSTTIYQTNFIVNGFEFLGNPKSYYESKDDKVSVD